MRDRLQLTFRSLEPSPALRQCIEEKAAKLDHFHDRIVACRIAVESPHRHHQHGRRFRVRIDVTVPGTELVAENPSDQPSAEDLYASVDSAFAVAQRVLVEHHRKAQQRARGAA